jgi:hypothetical protein
MLVGAVAGLAVGGTACGLPEPVPVGGVRAPITAENLSAARSLMPAGLLEPGWLPEGFELVHADYIKVGRHIETVDLAYQGPTGSLHIWQTALSPDELADKDPLAMGDPIPESEWNANPIPPAQTGRELPVVEYSRRLDDGRTVTVDSDLPDDVMRQVLEALVIRTDEAGR